MTDFYIFRHGDTSETDKFLLRFFGHKTKDSHNIDILPGAIPALKRIGKYLQNIDTDANFTSPYMRCLKSAKIVTEVSKKKYKADERIRELEKNGESLGSFRKRITLFLNEIQRKNYSAVSICTHGAVISAVQHLVISNKFLSFQRFFFPQPGYLLIIKNKKVEKINFNR